MSWLSDLAGKAENMLIKLDQNAATVLQQQGNADETTNLIEITTQNDNKAEDTAKPIRRNYSGSSLSMTRQNNSSPQRAMKLVCDTTDSPAHLPKSASFYSNVSEKIMTSSSNSRRSSVSSKANGTVVEKELESVKSVEDPIAMDFSVERELAAAKIILVEVKSERDELRCEVESLMEQIKSNNSQARVKELEDSYSALLNKRDELFETNASLENSNAKYIKSISELETIISKLHQNEVELTERLEMSRKETEHATTNLQQYRSRAQTTLQLKEQLIEQLKNGGIDHSESVDTNAAQLHQINILEMEQLRTENTHYLEETRLLSEQLDAAKAFIQKMETNSKQYENTMENQCKGLKESLSEEQKRSQTFEDELKVLAQELYVVRTETQRQNAVYSQKLHENEVEMSKMRSRITQRPSTGDSNNLEIRIQSLTQSLVQKQTSLEAATAECNALRLQFEKIESQHRSTVMQLRQQRPQFVSVNDTDDAKAQVPNFMQEHPFDTGVARRVKRAYSSVDSFGIRFGVFLRRYPLIRILVLGYVAFLHLWVIFVLLSSTPN